MKSVRVRALCALAALGMVFATPAAAADDPIRIGVLLPLSGALAKSGEDALHGFELFWDSAGRTASAWRGAT